MSYAYYLTLVIHKLREMKRHSLFAGICDANYAVYHRLGADMAEKHYKRLRNQIMEDLVHPFSWLDRSPAWRWKHGNVLPWGMLTRNMRVNMRVRYLENLIRKEQ